MFEVLLGLAAFHPDGRVAAALLLLPDRARRQGKQGLEFLRRLVDDHHFVPKVPAVVLTSSSSWQASSGS